MTVRTDFGKREVCLKPNNPGELRAFDRQCPPSGVRPQNTSENISHIPHLPSNFSHVEASYHLKSLLTLKGDAFKYQSHPG